MQIRLHEITAAEIPIRTRLPFRFGKVTMTAAPLLHVRVVAAAAGRHASGIASDLLVPKWFRKDTDRSAEADQQALRESVDTAVRLYREHDAMTCFAHWQRAHDGRIEHEAPTVPDLLERGFGTAIVERALIDATCRLAGVPFAAALANGLLGRRFQLMPPRESIAARHTVGRLDPLRADQIAPRDRLDDGFPQALDEVLATHGVRWLKVKIGGGHDEDTARLAAIGALLDELDLAAVRVTLDGNEQIADFDALRAILADAGKDRHGASMLRRVDFIEQPLLRFDSIGGKPDWKGLPLVLDEADAQRRTWRDSGYQGVSVKNCKGVFRALLNSERAATDPTLFQTSEDLTNVPALPVQQDLCTAAAIGLDHSERNGHHYFPGLDHLPHAVTAAALAAHPDLYARTERGAQLRIENGTIRLGSLQQVGYGCAQSLQDVIERELDWHPIG